jgi:ADP-heptose:LPS heptosyltransferase
MKEYVKRLAENSYSARFAVWLLVLNFVDLFAMLVPVRLEKPAKKRVLFTRLDSIGDYLIWTSCFKAIRETFPAGEYELVLLGNEGWRELVTEPGIFDKTLFANRRRLVADPVYRFRIMRQVRRTGAYAAINPTFSRDFLWADSIVRCSGSRKTIGSLGIANRMTALQQRICDSWYTRLVPPPLEGEHESISNLRFIRSISGKKVGPERIPLPAVPRADTKHFQLPNRYALFFLGAQYGYKRWPVERFAAAARFVGERFGLEIVTGGGPGEEFLGGQFADVFNGEFTDLIGKTSLSELGGIVAEAELLVTNDTSVCHIGIATETPTVVVNSGAHVGRFFPYPADRMAADIRQASVVHKMECFGCDWNCIYPELTREQPKPCIESVSTEQVIAAISDLMTQSADLRSTVHPEVAAEIL